MAGVIVYNEFNINTPGTVEDWSPVEYEAIYALVDKVGKKSEGKCLLTSKNLSDVNDAATARNNLGVPETFLDLPDTPANYTDAAGKIVAVNATADGLEFKAPGVVDFSEIIIVNGLYRWKIAIDGSTGELVFYKEVSGSYEESFRLD